MKEHEIADEIARENEHKLYTHIKNKLFGFAYKDPVKQATYTKLRHYLDMMIKHYEK